MTCAFSRRYCPTHNFGIVKIPGDGGPRVVAKKMSHARQSVDHLMVPLNDILARIEGRCYGK